MSTYHTPKHAHVRCTETVVSTQPFSGDFCFPQLGPPTAVVVTVLSLALMTACVVRLLQRTARELLVLSWTAYSNKCQQEQNNAIRQEVSPLLMHPGVCIHQLSGVI